MATPPNYPQVEILPDPARRWLLKQKPADWKGWWPATGAQMAALDSKADILLLGGAAGSLKTSTMLVDLIQERDWPRMRSYFFRKTYKELEGGDSAIDQSLRLYKNFFCDLFPNTSAVYNSSTHTWTWPSGAQFFFRHCQHKDDFYQYQGHAMSAGAIDESTHWEEKPVRYLMSRNRSVDSGMQIRWRLGTNPGNVGSAWHQKMFFPDIRLYPSKIQGVCPHCEPQYAPREGELRYDARWPSDGTPLMDEESGHKKSVSYILSYLREHALLGPGYAANLKMQSPGTAKALLEGCWKIFEGQYFDIFDPRRHVIKRQQVRDQWYWAHWTGTDYGYSGSAAATGLFCRTDPILPQWPQGRIIMLEEYPCDERGARREPVKTYAQNVYDRLLKKRLGAEQAHRIEANYLSPDSWNDRGDQHTLAGQMNDVLSPHGLGFEKARNDRAGGAQLLYSLFQDDSLAICDSCPNTIEAIQTRIKNPEEPADVLKVKEDPLDDYYDMIRYGVYSYHESALKPYRMRVDEKVAELYKVDPIQAMVRSQQIQWEEKQREGGSSGYVGGNIRHRLAEEAARNRR